MKIVIVDAYYPKFLAQFYTDNPGIKSVPYEEQKQQLLSTCFGTSDFYSKHLRSLGFDAVDLIANFAQLQCQWARENGFSINWVTSRLSPKWQRIPILGRFLSSSRGLLSIVLEQIRILKPDVLYMQDLNLIPPAALEALKSSVKLVVGQIACPLPSKEYLEPYDLIVSSFPHYVKRFRQQGKNAEYLRIGFEPSVLEVIGPLEKQFNCTFVGGISRAHERGAELLEYLAGNTDIEFFGYGAENLPLESLIKKKHHGQVWGKEMYSRLAQSRITINRHIDVAENYANNMRLYEATGCGTLLITDLKDNLDELFEIGREVVAYISKEDAVEKIRYYTQHKDEAKAIAANGQTRTLNEHNYANRMIELSDILRRYVK